MKTDENIHRRFKTRDLRNSIFLLSLYFCQNPAGAQQIRQAAWQQRADYRISVSLVDVQHRLKGQLELHYTNHSPDTLKELYFHLWPNAYSGYNAAFAKQEAQGGKDKFNTSTPDQKGKISGLAFSTGNIPLNWFVTDEPDIAVVKPLKALLPGESCTLSTPFEVKIPAQFSRMGHEQQNYQITQWFPKIAVYDVNGWNPMPYLNMGEFYSDFGKYEVSITLPSNYVVAATGILQDSAERRWLKNRSLVPVKPAIKTDYSTHVPSSAETKTLHYVQDSVTDFAWFADKEFNVSIGQHTLESGRTVETYVFTRSTAPQNAAHVAIGEALNYYGKRVGPYPYGQVSVVVSPLTAGGGMEYPMITVMSSASRDVIIHEVGHNWFQGMLASNERRFPWMDEGINSYYDKATVQYYDSVKKPRIRKKRREGSILAAVTNFPENILLYQLPARLNEDQPPGLSSENFTDINYAGMVYKKTGWLFGYLERYLGTETYDRCMQKYFTEWSFGHPLPGDIRDVFEKESGKPLGWLFDSMINTQGNCDLVLKKYDAKNHRVLVENKSDIALPVPVQTLKKGAIISHTWLTPFKGKQWVQLPANEADAVCIDAQYTVPESNLRNNMMRSKGMLRKFEPIIPRLAWSYPVHSYSSIHLMPAIGGNLYNGTLLVAAIYNGFVPSQKVEYMLVPMYGTKTKNLNGYYNFNINFKLHSHAFNRLEMGTKNALFNYMNTYYTDSVTHFDDNRFHRSTWYTRLYLRNHTAASRRLFRYFELNYNQVNLRHRGSNDLIDPINGSDVKRTSQGYYLNLSYLSDNQRKIGHLFYKLHLETIFGRQSDYYLLGPMYNNTETMIRLQGWLKHYITYRIKNKGLRISAYAGTFLFNRPDASQGLYMFRIGGNTGIYDYQFSEVLPGRSEGLSNSAYSRQLLESRGGIHTRVSLLPGNTSMGTLSLISDLPAIPLQVFWDGAMLGKRTYFGGSRSEFAWTGGLALKMGEGFSIYWPMVQSDNIKNAYDLNKIGFRQRIVFMLNLNEANVWDLVRRIARN